MRLTIIPDDKLISVNDEYILNIQQDFSWISPNIHAVQWYDTWGEVEYKDVKTPNERIEELGIYAQAPIIFHLEKERLEKEKIRIEEERIANTDWMSELRALRNKKLLECDWTQLPNAPISPNKKIEWEVYRQQLRNLTDVVEDARPYVESIVNLECTLDPFEVGWPKTPQ